MKGTRIQLTDVEILAGRWSVRILGRDDQGHVVAYIASADSWYIGMSDGIWFGTEEEYAADAP